ncbi:hypothetical protein AB1Y20_018373 [Prymnesium parvum]|uniref:Uncharacterized protein n=1 Tax=Prymnesium parvum TaxID=97485 RepID=A0AB34JRG8_PRYPA
MSQWRGKGGKGRGRGEGREPREEHGAPPRQSRASAPSAPVERGKGGLEKALREMEGSGDEDYVELAKSMHALLRLEAISHEALMKRVGELEGALATANEELSRLRAWNERLNKQLERGEQRVAGLEQK